MSYLELLDSMVTRVARPFAKADSWSEYAGRAYWWLGATCLAGVIIFLLAGGYVGGIMSRAPSSVISYLEPFFEWFKPANLLKAWPLSLGLIVIYGMVGLIPQFRGLRNFLGGLLADSFYRATETFIGLGEWCIRHRGGSMMLIGLLALLIGWATTVFFTTKSQNEMREHRLGRWQAEAERFVLEEAMINYNKERLSNLEDLWQPDYTKLLKQPGDYTHTALYLHDALRLLNMPENYGGDYSRFLKSRMVNFKNDKDVETSGLEEFAARCRDLPDRHAATRDEELRACDALNLLLGKLNFRFVDDQIVPEAEQFDHIKKAVGYYRKVGVSHYTGDDLGRRFIFAVNNGMGTAYTAMLSYLMVHPGAATSGAVADAPCKTEADCVRNGLAAYEEAQRSLPLDPENPRSAMRCSPQAQALANNLTDLLRRISLDFKAISDGLGKDNNTKQLARMQGEDSLRRYIEENITKMMSCNPDVASLPDLVTTAQAYAACAALAGPTDPDARRLTRAAGLYLRLANSINPDEYPKWDLTNFCAIDRDAGLGDFFNGAVADEALSGVPQLPINALRGEINKACQRQTSGRL